MIYENLSRYPGYSGYVRPDEKETINCNFVKGAFVEILGNTVKRYSVDFSDGVTSTFTSIIGNNQWTKCFHQYYIPYLITVNALTDGKNLLRGRINLENQHVVIELCSSSLGDTLAWFPYVEEFRKKHGCRMTAITFHNYFFKETYPNINFVEPGSVVNNVMAWYEIGWFYDGDKMNRFKHPREVKDQPLQKTSADILGLEFREMKPLINFTPKDKPSEKYVCIAPHSTAQIKYWNRPNGWQEVVDYLKSVGYKVICLSKEPDGYMGNMNPQGVYYPTDHNIDTTMNYLYHCDFFIGVGSGLAWLSWALDKPTVVISGFSRKYTEMQEGENVIRIGTPEGFATGAFNDYKLDAGDWDWCPYPGLKGTDRQWEDSASITSEMVINEIQKFIKQ